ncbi:MAG TPA: hypothetical protein VFG20_05365 [Planctomycetaceae bacterium]|nr:hypothetical protein [Planctomycetaceae bacterium]
MTPSLTLVLLLAFADDPRAIFERRILPILNSPKPSSCAECHLSGVDLKDYLRPNPYETFAALNDAGLIDLKQPKQSKLLQFIGRKPEKPMLVPAAVREEELAAFTAWIEAAVADPMFREAKIKAVDLGPQIPKEVIRHGRSDQVLASFVEHIWSESLRCAACHSPTLNKKQVEKFGERVSWIVPDNPAATLQKLRDQGLIDLDKPAESLLLQKPTMQVEHGGGQKMLVGDRSYKQFLAFIEDYAKSSRGEYRSAKDLPSPLAEVGRATDVWFKLTDAPESFDKMLLRVDLYRIEPGKPGWSKDRWATGDRAVFGKGKLWQQHLTVTAPRDSARAKEIATKATLPPGKYHVRVLVDRTGRLEKNPQETLDERDQVAEFDMESRWPTGYGSMTSARFPPVSP